MARLRLGTDSESWTRDHAPRTVGLGPWAEECGSATVRPGPWARDRGLRTTGLGLWYLDWWGGCDGCCGRAQCNESVGELGVV